MLLLSSHGENFVNWKTAIHSNHSNLNPTPRKTDLAKGLHNSLTIFAKHEWHVHQAPAHPRWGLRA